MNSVVTYIGSFLSSFLDPLELLVFLASGWFIRRLWLALAVSISWQILLYAVLFQLVANQPSPGGEVRLEVPLADYLGSFCGALLATFVIFRLAAHYRKRNLRENMTAPASQMAQEIAAKKVCTRRVLTSAALLGAALAACLVYAQMMLNHYHAHDPRVAAMDLVKAGATMYFKASGPDAPKHFWAIDLPGGAEMIFTFIPVAWICLMVFYYKWPRLYLYAIPLYLYIGFTFMAILGGLDMGSFL